MKPKPKKCEASPFFENLKAVEAHTKGWADWKKDVLGKVVKKESPKSSQFDDSESEI